MSTTEGYHAHMSPGSSSSANRVDSERIEPEVLTTGISVRGATHISTADGRCEVVKKIADDNFGFLPVVGLPLRI